MTAEAPSSTAVNHFRNTGLKGKETGSNGPLLTLIIGVEVQIRNPNVFVVVVVIHGQLHMAGRPAQLFQVGPGNSRARFTGDLTHIKVL